LPLFFLTARPPTALSPFPLHDALPIWVMLALVLLLGVTGALTAATVGGTEPGFFTTSATRTRVIQISAVAMALALFIIMRSCKRSEEHTSELQSLTNLVCRLLLEKKKP